LDHPQQPPVDLYSFVCKALSPPPPRRWVRQLVHASHSHLLHCCCSMLSPPDRSALFSGTEIHHGQLRIWILDKNCGNSPQKTIQISIQIARLYCIGWSSYRERSRAQGRNRRQTDTQPPETNTANTRISELYAAS
jgi:hypothetical protein